MLDAPEALLRSIRLGEGAHLELKEVVFAGKRVKGPAREQFADELAAFANAHGGVLVLGVDDRTRPTLRSCRACTPSLPVVVNSRFTTRRSPGRRGDGGVHVKADAGRDMAA